ncbi:ubiquinone biosynthesis protein COQ9 [Morchella conica CCBAS932]|uniref:Ubiquinone biosynthesis protein n=1 Tax=Morchella conica CCBAS932 TaxID=1392247 RepID=A0A3N4K8E2_9PEZI|nr:ubiquinone biosynthesis protein COQ9 [Morchella conica CCBAS932]
MISTLRYHSYQHPSPAPPFTPTESSILSAALRHVPSHGFSTTTLSLGARDVGYLDISTNLFPRGVFDLVNYHLVTERLRLSQKVDFSKFEDGTKRLSTPAKIRVLCAERLRANSPLINRWQEALGLMSLAGNIPASVSELAKLSDEMWFLAGDDSHDMNWYTKRATLSGVYASTELFMTQDTSPDFEETWKFLDRRLDDVKSLGSSVSNISSYLDFTAHAFSNVLRSKSVPFF